MFGGCCNDGKINMKSEIQALETETTHEFVSGGLHKLVPKYLMSHPHNGHIHVIPKKTTKIISAPENQRGASSRRIG